MFYQLASGHTTTGFSTIFSKAFVTQWGPIGITVTAIAMAIGASACSTGGGIKGIRMGIISKAFIQDIRRMVSPEAAVIVQKYHHIRDIWIDDGLVRTAATVTIAYVTLYALATLVGVIYNFPLDQAAFEAVSAASNTGLSCGVTAPTMPWLMKGAYMVSMWLGRLEFMSVFALIGFSLGGGIAISFALTYPAAVDALILVGSLLPGRRLSAELAASFGAIWSAISGAASWVAAAAHRLWTGAVDASEAVRALAPAVARLDEAAPINELDLAEYHRVVLAQSIGEQQTGWPRADNEDFAGFRRHVPSASAVTPWHPRFDRATVALCQDRTGHDAKSRRPGGLGVRIGEFTSVKRAVSTVSPGPKAAASVCRSPGEPFLCCMNSLSTKRIVALLMLPYRLRTSRDTPSCSGRSASASPTLSRIAFPPGWMAQWSTSRTVKPWAWRSGSIAGRMLAPSRSGR